MSGRRLGMAARARLACRVWVLAARAMIEVRREPLPKLVRSYATRANGRGPKLPPWLLASAVDRALRVRNLRPRCLINALVLYRLLREQGDDAELVIGLPGEARDHRAHAWVELDGRDVGPPPGRAGHEPLARFGA